MSQKQILLGLHNYKFIIPVLIYNYF